MTRNATLQVRNLNVVRLFVAAFTLMFALEGVAQQLEKIQLSEKSTSVVNPSFLPAVSYATGGNSSASVAVADVNKDGKQDLIVASENDLGVLLGNGDGTFQAVVNFGRGGNSVVVADVNEDGTPDLVVARSGMVDVLLGNGDGSFRPAVSYATSGNDTRSSAIADLNGDGRLDLIVANCASSGIACLGRGNVGVLLGNGGGTFQPVVTYDSGGNDASSVALADINGDGLTDVVVTNACSDTNCTLGSVAVLFGNGHGLFSPPTVYSTAGGAFWVTLADVNGDGRPDILVADGAGVDVLLSNTNGSFDAAVTYDQGGYNDLSVAVADVNGDRMPDLITAKRLDGSNSQGLVNVLLGNGDGTFQSALSYPSGGFDAWSLAIADFNGDGKPDVVAANLFTSITNPNGKLGMLLNNTPFCASPPVITVFATPSTLWPPNGKKVPVVVSGTVSDIQCKVRTAAYATVDEYGEVQPSGPVTLDARGSYSFTIGLQASRMGSDHDGRHYAITVQAEDVTGNVTSETSVITVPHDRGK